MDLIKIALPVRSQRWAPYLIAVLTILVVVAAHSLFAATLESFPYLLAFIAVTLSAFFGGMRPAVLTAVVVGLFVQYYVLPPTHTFALIWPKGYIGMGFYAAQSSIVIVLMNGLFAAHESLQANEILLQRMNEGLEKRVAERTANLAASQQELLETNQNLERIVEARVGELKLATEDVQRFLYIASHDLRAPLVNILGFTSELDALRGELATFVAEVHETAPALVTQDRRAAIEAELPEAIGFIRSSTTKMDRLINAILKISRDGQRTLKAEAIDMGALVEAQAATLAQQMSTKDAALAIEGSLPNLTSDRLAVEQIFGNLIENAVKYLAPSRPGRIVVRGAAEGQKLRYDIVDNGRGIEAKDFGRIFDLFRRSGEQDTPGEGIGLAYVQNLVRRLGGQVSVKSDFGVGSTFTVTFPSALRSRLD